MHWYQETRNSYNILMVNPFEKNGCYRPVLHGEQELRAFCFFLCFWHCTTELLSHLIFRQSPPTARNTMRLHYRDQSLNVV
jgi:hypothetical protein